MNYIILFFKEVGFYAPQLKAITNINMPKNSSKSYLNDKLERLKALRFIRPKHADKEREKQESLNPKDWEYNIYNFNDDLLKIEIESDFAISIIIYPKITVFSTVFRYSTLYKCTNDSWFLNLRKEMYNILKIFEGTEVIYSPDNTAIYDMACNNISYATIKKKIIADFGQPVIDFKKLDYNSLSYSNITEFVLDDFKKF